MCVALPRKKNFSFGIHQCPEERYEMGLNNNEFFPAQSLTRRVAIIIIYHACCGYSTSSIFHDIAYFLTGCGLEHSFQVQDRDANSVTLHLDDKLRNVKGQNPGDKIAVDLSQPPQIRCVASPRLEM